MVIDPTRLSALYHSMQRLRRFEERVSSDFRDGRIPGIVHLGLGQEAIAAAVAANLREDDYVVSNHRGHGHLLAKGAPADLMMAEIWGKASGLGRGKGGSMHLAHVASGAMGANGIVGGGLPYAAGLGMAIRARGTEQVVAAYFGDGTISTGAFHEGTVLTSVLSLPVLLVAENNGYSETTGADFHLCGQSMVERLSGYGLRASQVDGMDAAAIDAAVAELVAYIRTERRPALIEAATYRYHGHYEGEFAKYRTREEIAARRAGDDPIDRARTQLLAAGVAAAELDAIDRAVDAEIDAAAEFAAASPLPEPETTLEGVYL